MQIEAPPIKCYLLTPKDSGFTKTRELIAQTLQECGVEPILWERLDETAQMIWESYLNEIRRSDFVIADLTGTDPNVMFEFGYANALRKSTLLLVQKTLRSVPKNLLGSHLVNVYEPDQPESLRHVIRAWIPTFISLVDTEVLL